MEEKLKQLGLSYNERRVYLSLLKIGETSVGDIIKDVNAHRQSVYNALEELDDKGLILRNQKNRINHYKIADPDAFAEGLKKKELVAKQLGKEIAKELSKSRHEHEINVYDGAEKIRNFFYGRDKKLPRGATIRVVSNYGKKYEEVLGEDFLLNRYNKLTIKKKQFYKIITSESKRSELRMMEKKLGSIKERKLRYISDEIMPPLAVEIWDGGMSFSSFEDDWFVIEIKNKAFQVSYQKYFEVLWKMAKK